MKTVRITVLLAVALVATAASVQPKEQRVKSLVYLSSSESPLRSLTSNTKIEMGTNKIDAMQDY